MFEGRQISYTKGLQRTKGGGWGLVTETIPHGLALDIALAHVEHTVRVDVRATQTQVGLPIPVVRIRPPTGGTPIELERPEWSTARLRTSFRIPPGGGGAALYLDGLPRGDEERIALVLTVVPAITEQPVQQGVR